MKMNRDFTRQPGCKPGSDKAIKQHKAMADGYVVTGDDFYPFDNGQKKTKTGGVWVPGLTSKKGK